MRLVPLLVLAACECGDGGSLSSDGGETSPYAPRDAWSADALEPCAEGIETVAVDVPPMEGARPDLLHLAGEGDRVWVAQTDVRDGGALGRLTVADATTGARVFFGEVAMDDASAWQPRAVRADGSEWEVLFAAGTGSVAVARFGPSEPVVHRVAGDVGMIYAATPLEDGFLWIDETSDGWGLVRWSGREAVVTPLALERDVPSIGGVCASAALSETTADGIVYGVVATPGAEGHALVGLAIDLSGAEPRVRTRELDGFARPGCDAIAADVVGSGVWVGARVVADGETRTRHYWLDAELNELARRDLPTSGPPVGAAGRAIAFEDWSIASDALLYVALADGPGVVRGGERPLVNGLTATYGTSLGLWESAPSTISVAFDRAGVEVISLCGR